MGERQHGLYAFTNDEGPVTRDQPDGIAQEVTHGPTRCFDIGFALAVKRKPSAMHAPQGACPIGDRSDQCWSGDRLGLTHLPMPALGVEAQGLIRHLLADAPGAEVGFRKRACDRH